MLKNVEIKARLREGQMIEVRDMAFSLASGPTELLQQTDTFYCAKVGRLKLRESWNGGSELIAYSRPDQMGPKLSSYVIYQCTNPGSLHEVLAQSLGVRGIVRKTRQVVHIGQTRVHLDEVSGLGEFMELEVVLRPDQPIEEGENIASDLLKTLGIESSALLKGAYIDLLGSPCRLTNRST